MERPSAVFMAIKRPYAELILRGTKTVELRTKPLVVPAGTPIVIYASGHGGRVVGTVEAVGLLEDTPEKLWQRVERRAQIARDDYDEYFKDRAAAFAIELARPRTAEPLALPWRAQPGWKALRPESPEHAQVLRHVGLL